MWGDNLFTVIVKVDLKPLRLLIFINLIFEEAEVLRWWLKLCSILLNDNDVTLMQHKELGFFIFHGTF